MEAKRTVRQARTRAGLSLRELARRSGTSHATIVAYEAGEKVPSVATLDRIVRRAGFSLEVELAPLAAASPRDRGRELEDALELASQFPARHSASIEYPVFGRSS